jgi:hypothetical protein
MSDSISNFPSDAEYLYSEAANYSFAWGRYPKNEREAMRLLKKSASLDSIDAYLLMGDIYENGGPFDDSGFSGNYQKAIDCYIQAGRLGSVWAYYELALIYAGRFQDEMNARKCFILCAEKIIKKENGFSAWLDSDKLETLAFFVTQSVPFVLAGKRDKNNLALFHNLFVEFSLVIFDKVMKKYEEIISEHKDEMSVSRYNEWTSEFRCYEEYIKEHLPAEKNEATSEVSDMPTQTLPEVLAWLCTQNSVPLAVLRQKLLPLGLMPSAVMDDVNERAYDVAGEPALDEAGGIVTVQRGVLLQVLAVW